MKNTQILDPWLVAFSIRKNLKATFNLKRAPNDIESIHGIRFLNAFLLLVSHKSMAIFFNPYINRTHLSETLGQPWTVLGRAAAIYTDTFLMFSGLLTSYAIIGRLQKKQSPRIFQEYAGRFIRIVPTLGALILFCTFILPRMDSGPQWNLVVTRHAGICKQHWWRNLLFIHNYFGFENMVCRSLYARCNFVIDFFLVLKLTLVFDPHPSPWHRYRTVCGGTRFHLITVEMAKERCNDIIGHSRNQYDCPI